MEAVRSIRIHLPDRPGSLSSISTALAVHDVNIVRLRVVSHEGATVVDDLDLAAATENDLDRAIAGFYPDVRVERFERTLGDPVASASRAFAAIAAAPTLDAALRELAAFAPDIVRADSGVLFEMRAGALTGVAAAMAPLTEAQVSGLAGVLDDGAAALVTNGAESQRTAAARVSESMVLAVTRCAPIDFVSGELERLAAFAAAAGAVLALK